MVCILQLSKYFIWKYDILLLQIVLYDITALQYFRYFVNYVHWPFSLIISGNVILKVVSVHQSYKNTQLFMPDISGFFIIIIIFKHRFYPAVKVI